MWFRLASHLKMAVSEAMQRISSEEFTYWVAYLGDYCLDQEGWEQAAVLCSVVSNCAGAKTTPQDFLPVRRPKTKKQQTPDQMIAVMEAMFSGSDD
tara:strand:+ start:140 stop:427 length:288 start_codon:yes stop_codon:yes gene_type:complete